MCIPVLTRFDGGDVSIARATAVGFLRRTIRQSIVCSTRGRLTDGAKNVLAQFKQ